MRPTSRLLFGIALSSACSSERIATDSEWTVPAADRVDAAATGPGQSEVRKDLAALRQVTAGLHEFEAAKQAGWEIPITGCMVDPTLGGMGFHYGKGKLIDGNVRADEPELLLFEPESNGRMRLVAVEYIVPLAMWTGSKPPRLFNQDFKVNAAFQIWALHAWVWDDNPSGMFADWNPRVNCDNASEVSAMVHD